MFPWLEIGVLILKLLPQIVLSPIFWVVMLLVFSQYRRINNLERSLFGVTFSSVGRQVWRSLLYGLLGGVAGSFLLVLVGVSLSGPALFTSGRWP